MAPIALTDLHDPSGYTPETVQFGKSSAYTKERDLSKASNTGNQVLNSRTVFEDGSSECSPNLYFWNLSSEEVGTIEESVWYFQSLDLPLNAINTETFPLTAALRSKLRSVTARIYGEQQFLIICGLNPFQYGEVENVIVHAGIASHIGDRRGMAGREGGDNAVLHHITAIPPSTNANIKQYHGPPNESRDIPFHRDNGDIVSLYALSRSQSGGSLYLADSAAVYKELAALKPELADALRGDWTMVSPSPSKAFDTRPLVFPQSESSRVLINCSRARITGTPSAPRPSSLPPLTKTQRQALDALHMLAMKRATEIQIQPGDMVFFNNLGMMHARDAFVDNEEAGRKRHLLRLILRDEERAYETPKELRETWKALYEHCVEEEVFPVKEELFSFATSH